MGYGKSPAMLCNCVNANTSSYASLILCIVVLTKCTRLQFSIMGCILTIAIAEISVSCRLQPSLSGLELSKLVTAVKNYHHVYYLKVTCLLKAATNLIFWSTIQLFISIVSKIAYRMRTYARQDLILSTENRLDHRKSQLQTFTW